MDGAKERRSKDRQSERPTEQKTYGWSKRAMEQKSDGAKSDGAMERQMNRATERQMDRATERRATER